jgi:hypothetical protein
VGLASRLDQLGHHDQLLMHMAPNDFTNGIHVAVSYLLNEVLG